MAQQRPEEEAVAIPVLMSPDTDDDGVLDVEHYALPEPSAVDDPYFRKVYANAKQEIESNEDLDDIDDEEEPGDNEE